MIQKNSKLSRRDYLILLFGRMIMKKIQSGDKVIVIAGKFK